jgi:hypothetical protein
MLRELVEMKPEKNCTFQVMLLRNDESKEVEVHEETEVDFSRIQYHLNHGGSVFITSRPSEKIKSPLQNKPHKRRPMRTVTAHYFNHV